MLSEAIINFFKRQGFVIVSTLDERGRIHCSAKGIVGIEKKGKVYLIDLYKANTFKNLKRSPIISITAIEEHSFIGYTLKGKATIVGRKRIERHIAREWEEILTRRISRRLIKNVKDYRKARHHPEASFPLPRYLIEMDVEEIVDLTPRRLKDTRT